MQADDQTPGDSSSQPPGPPPSLWRTLRFGTRAAWDSLGLVCAVSLTLFVALLPPAAIALRIAASLPLALLAASAIWALLVPPLFAGACEVAHRILEHDDPSYAGLWGGFRTLYGRAAALGAIDLAITVALVANIAFYLSRGGIAWILVGVVFLYLLLFWLMNVLYHIPLLIAADKGIIQREGGGRARVSSALRNGLLLTLSAPGYTFGLLAILIVVGVPTAISGVGMALIAPAFAAVLTTRATRDQLTRFGMLPPEPDPDEPVSDEGWRRVAEREKGRRGEGENGSGGAEKQGR